jgi:hypothetical protein
VEFYLKEAKFAMEFFAICHFFSYHLRYHRLVINQEFWMKFGTKDFTVQVDEKLFHNVIHGDMSSESIEMLKEKGAYYINFYHPKIAVIDVRNIPFGKFEKIRSHFVEMTKRADFKKAAIIISSKFQKVIGNFILAAGQAKAITKFFISEEEAMEWLQRN